jgi:multiple sugar transport system permease protein
MAGVSIWGWDIAGFSGEIPSVELYLRSTQMACFCPVMQYHSELHQATECRDRTPWNVAERHGDPRALTIYRAYAQLRMRLLDYVADEAEALAAVGQPLMRMPALVWPEAHDALLEDPDSYLFGRDLLVCPVLEKGAETRTVRLPPGDWVDLWSGAAFDGDRWLVAPAPLERIPVFVRADSPRLDDLLAAARGFEVTLMYERGARRWLVLALFLGPSLAGVVLFVAGPIVASLALAFTSWDLLTPPTFVGLRNFERLSRDLEFWAALRHTVTFLAGYVPLVLVAGLAVAVALNGRVPARGVFRAIYFLPVVTSWVAVALVWKWLLNPQFGLVNAWLAQLGIQGPAWLFDPNWAMAVGDPHQRLEGHRLRHGHPARRPAGDPARVLRGGEHRRRDPRQQLRHVTVPLLAPAIFFALTISLINSFQVFDQVYVMTGGGPAGATTVLVERIVKQAFSFSRMGYASAMSWVLFVLIFATTFVLSRLQRRWT